MPALSYKSRFVSLVVSGAKPHSIRAWRRRPFRVADVIMHYTAMRTKACRKIRPDTICLAAPAIEVNAKRGYVVISGTSNYYDAGRLTAYTVERLAASDGFACADDFFAFFREEHGGIVCGQLVEWNPFAQVFQPSALSSQPSASLSGALSVGVQAVCTPQARALGADAQASAATSATTAAK